MGEITAPALTRERFSNLRGVRWRIDLGILPDSPRSIEEFRRVAADSRRRYVNLRRRLLIDPHLTKDESRIPDPSVENPLSQNPDSTWDRFFRNAELEKEVNQDLSRLYPEIDDFFQDPSTQSMLGRILLVWCLTNPNFGYRQGMHELLAPLLYILHIDLEFFSQIRTLHEKHFLTEFDTNLTKKPQNSPKMTNSPSLDPKTLDLFLLNDPYGSEGELGIILSEKFIEHDAFSMFDTIMNGSDGPVAIAQFYSMDPINDSNYGLTPIREASLQIYHLLSLVDPSLHSHLEELGVEPQYFALRWLRVFFGREFCLKDLLIVWDEIFRYKNEVPSGFFARGDLDRISRVLCNSPRGTIILALAVSMLLYLRPLLLSSEHATTCLQRLLNFPEDLNVNKLIEKAKSVQVFAMEVYLESSSSERKSGNFLNVSNYWEDKWSVFQENEEVNNNNGDNNNNDDNKKKGGSIIQKLKLGFLKEKEKEREKEKEKEKEKEEEREGDKNEKKDRWGTIRRVILDENVEINFNNDTKGQSSTSNNKMIFENDIVNSNSRNNISDISNNSEFDNGGLVISGEGDSENEENYDNTLAGIDEVYNQIIMGIEAETNGGQNRNLENIDEELIGKLKGFGQSMVGNIEVIESVFQKELGSNSNDSTKEDEAMNALLELRKISDFLSQL